MAFLVMQALSCETWGCMFHDVCHAVSNVCGMLCAVCLVTTVESWLGGVWLQKAIPDIKQPCFAAPAALHV